jgi:hypothetical protein
MLAWRAYKAAQLCPHCGRPWAVHDVDKVEDYTAGFLDCTATLAVNTARAQRAKSVLGEREAAAAKDTGVDVERSRVWLSWPVGTAGPTFEPLD